MTSSANHGTIPKKEFIPRSKSSHSCSKHTTLSSLGTINEHDCSSAGTLTRSSSPHPSIPSSRTSVSGSLGQHWNIQKLRRESTTASLMSLDDIFGEDMSRAYGFPDRSHTPTQLRTIASMSPPIKSPMGLAPTLKDLETLSIASSAPSEDLDNATQTPSFFQLICSCFAGRAMSKKNASTNDKESPSITDSQATLGPSVDSEVEQTKLRSTKNTSVDACNEVTS